MATLWQFCTLYTNVPHNKLKIVKRELMNFCFQVGDKQFVTVTKFVATWTDHKSNIKAIKFLLGICFLNFGNLLYRQIIEILKGYDPAPLMVNLFLY